MDLEGKKKRQGRARREQGDECMTKVHPFLFAFDFRYNHWG